MSDFFLFALCFALITACAALFCISVLAGALGQMPPYLAFLLAAFALAVILDIARPTHRGF